MRRLPSKGIGFLSGCRRGAAIAFFMPSSRTLREGQVIHEKTTVSSSLRLTAIGKDVVAPSGTSLPQHSTTFTAPCSLKTTAMHATRIFRDIAADRAGDLRGGIGRGAPIV